MTIESKHKIIDFIEAKNKADGIITPAMLRKSMDEWIDNYGKIKHMVVVYVYPTPGDDKTLSASIGYSNMNDLELMGILQWAKQIIEHRNDD
jgi:hypothetical protein